MENRKQRSQRQPHERAVKAFNRGVALQRREDYAAAAGAYREVITLVPRMAEAHNNLGVVLTAMGRGEDALDCYRQALGLNPRYHAAMINFATALQLQERHEEALVHLQEALRIRPDHVDGYHRLSLTLLELGRQREAHEVLLRAAELAPDNPAIIGNLAMLEHRLGRHAEAVRRCEQALAADPSVGAILNTLATTLKDEGRSREAVETFRRALEAAPHETRIRSSLLFALNYLHDLSPEEVFEEHRRIEEHAAGIVRVRRHDNPRDPERRLRVGYLSPDFRQHSVAHFIAAVLWAHDAGEVEVHCYSDTSKPDEVTEQLRSRVPHWHESHRLSDEELGEAIQRDGIDILVDLAGHTAGGRPMLLARKPAPLQVTYLGYPNTTGLSTVDYRITDELADPQGMTEHLHTERLVRLPGGFLCYLPQTELDEPSAPPCFRAKGVTFGSFNLLAKTTPELIRVWSRILHEVEDSRLLLKARALEDESVRRRIREEFAAEGIAPDRLELLARVPDRRAHYHCYGRMDIALDPFPYNGTTTTCEALWMGVPVVALAGRHHAARVGASLLGAIGREEWVAGSEDEYVAVAARLARDPAELASIRFGLRDRMRSSPLLDVRRIARELEEAYRTMWRHHCGVPAASACPAAL